METRENEYRNFPRPPAGDRTLVSSPAWTVKEAAAFLNCKRSHIYMLIHRGELAYQRLGDHFVVRAEECRRLLERGWRRNGEVKES